MADPSFVADQLKVLDRHPGRQADPGLHGHSLDSVSVGGTTLQTGSTNTIPASPPPQFTLQLHQRRHEHRAQRQLQGHGQQHQHHGQDDRAADHPGAARHLPVTLNASPPAGNYTVTATIGKVPGEKTITNNTLTFPVTFQ